jgi:DNA-binding GntR family transcriptional regulator
VSTADIVERRVLDALMRGEYAPGTRLRQDDLASSLGVSKIPVREALQRLSAGGLLVFETNRGARVPEMTVADAIENASLRRAVETELLRAAITKLTIVDLAEAEHALELAGTSSGLSSSTSSVTEANWQFHRALYRASTWRRGLAIAEFLHAAMAPYVLLYLGSLGGEAPSDDEHRALLELCRGGHADAAIELLQVHLDNAGRAVIDFLRQQDIRP